MTLADHGHSQQGFLANGFAAGGQLTTTTDGMEEVNPPTSTRI